MRKKSSAQSAVFLSLARMNSYNRKLNLSYTLNITRLLLVSLWQATRLTKAFFTSKIVRFHSARVNVIQFTPTVKVWRILHRLLRNSSLVSCFVCRSLILIFIHSMKHRSSSPCKQQISLYLQADQTTPHSSIQFLWYDRILSSTYVAGF